MRTGRIRFGLYVIGAAAVLLFAGCPNPLLTQIEEAVEEVVTPPGIAAVYPAADAKDIAVNLQVITVTLSKPILASSVTTGTFKVTGTGEQTVAGTFEISNDTITFKPNGTLDYDTEYTITITGVKDADGNALPSTFSWTFRTGLAPDTQPPDNIIVTINNDDLWATSAVVTLTITADDDRGVAQMNVSNTNSFSDAGWVTFQSPYEWTLQSSQGTNTVYVKIRDGAGNTSDTAESDSIDLDTIVPEIETFRVNYGNPATNSTLVLLTLDGNDAGSGAHQFRYRYSGGEWESWIDLTGEGLGEIADVPLTVAEFGTEGKCLKHR